jgi:hypothetical protein
VIATSVTTDASMGLVFSHDESRKVALIAPTDIDTPTEKHADRHVVLYHPGYRKGTDPVEFPFIEKLRMNAEGVHNDQLAEPKPQTIHDDNYKDPVAAVAKEYQGRWIAGFAHVGNTGFVTVVQQRFDEAVSLDSATLWNLAFWSALASLIAVGILAMVVFRWARNRRLEAPSTPSSA